METTVVRITFGLLLSAIRLARANGATKPASLMVDVDTACGLRTLEVRSVHWHSDGASDAQRECVMLHVTPAPTVTACHELPRWLAAGPLGVLFLAEVDAELSLTGRGFVRHGTGIDGIRAIHVIGPGTSCIDLSSCAAHP